MLHSNKRADQRRVQRSCPVDKYIVCRTQNTFCDPDLIPFLNVGELPGGSAELLQKDYRTTGAGAEKVSTVDKHFYMSTACGFGHVKMNR